LPFSPDQGPVNIPNRSFAFEVLEDLKLLVSYQGPSNPSDAEWAAYLQVLERLHRAPHPYRYLTISDGGHPSRAQQAQVKAVTHGRTPAVAIVSSSVPIRFVGSLLALFNPRVQCFGPEQLHRAFAHIELDPAAVSKVRACLDALKQKVAASSKAA
jgi:hypothetical protein